MTTSIATKGRQGTRWSTPGNSLGRKHAVAMLLLPFLLLLLPDGLFLAGALCLGSSSTHYFRASFGHRSGLYRLGSHRARTLERMQVQWRLRKQSLGEQSPTTPTMRDRSSSYWFSVGDRVRVVEDVYATTTTSIATSSNNNDNDNPAPPPTTKVRQNLRGRTGTVVETWEKCDVDPTCCCAEQVDTDMAVRVALDGPQSREVSCGITKENKTENENETLPGATTASAPVDPFGEDCFYYYFAEDELVRLR